MLPMPIMPKRTLVMRRSLKFKAQSLKPFPEASPTLDFILQSLHLGTMWKVLITASAMNRAGQKAQALLHDAGCDLVIPQKFGPLRAAALSPLLLDKDAVIASLDEYSAEILNSPAAARLKIISRWGVGYDSIDVAAATRRGIAVAYTPGL